MSRWRPKYKNGRKSSADRRRYGRWTPPDRSAERLPAVQQCLFDGMGDEPVIIERPDHNISRSNIDREALKVLYRLKEKGHTAFLVGGSVRDLQLGKTPKDFDVGTDATPEQIRKIFRHSRIIGKRFRLVHVYFRGKKIIEVSTFRKKTDLADTEAAREGFGNSDIFGSPREDAFRRDITINGLFYNIADFSIIDYVGGMKDLENGIIRAIGDPERRFLRDPVRMMRVVRHAARTGFEIDSRTLEAVRKHADKIRLCAVPRVRDEWLKDVQTGVSAKWCRMMIECGLFQAVFPSYSHLPATDMEGDPGSLETRRVLLHLLEYFDVYVKKHGALEEPMILAILAYPLLRAMPEWNRLRSDRIRWATHEIRMLTSRMFMPYDFGRYSREIMNQILATLNPIDICVSRKSWPKRVCSKEFFPAALELYNAIRVIDGKAPAGNVRCKPFGKNNMKKRRKPYYGRNRKR